jgi:small-conductance mechanosensitive channel
MRVEPRRWLGAALALWLGLLLASLPLAQAQALPPAPASAWVELDGRRVMELRVAAGAQNTTDLARRVSRELRRMANDPSIAPDDLVLQEASPYWMVALRQPDGRIEPRLAIDERAARSFGVSQQALALTYRDQLREAIRSYRNQHSTEAWLLGSTLALLVLALYVGWLFWQRRLMRLLRRWLQSQTDLRIGALRLPDLPKLRAALLLGLSAAHWLLVLLISYLLIPLLLGLFPPTRALAAGLRGQILAAVGLLGQIMLGAAPGLLSILLVLGVTLLLLRLSNASFRAVDQGRLRLPGFYPEWGRPTGRIAAVLIVCAGLVVAYPYIPGAGSRSFQGAGLFVGLLAALGSSAIATNVISGLMLIYTRGFQEGDRVEINGVLGIVEDRALLVTRIRTPRHELVSIPNATVIGASVVNYSLSGRETQQPVALAATVTIGYDVPWRQVHALLLGAARSVPAIAADPEPFVLQTALNDFHISYEITAHLIDVQHYRQTLSDLLAAIQDQFAAADVEILSPAYHAMRNGNASTVPRAFS